MALTSTSFNIIFDQQANPKVFRFVDTTNYAAQGVLASDCKCVLEITAPGGAIYYTNSNYSNPDINPGTSPNSLITILLNIGANGLVVPGTYTFKMTTLVGGAPSEESPEGYFVTKTYSYNYQYSSPVVSINESVNCISPLFTSTDTTVYTVNGIIPTIDRVHSVYFPAGSGLSTSTSSAETVTFGANQFANGTQSTQITTDLTYVSGNVTILDTVTGALEILVDCQWTCKLTCCLTALNNRMESLRTSNYQAFLEVKDLFVQVMSKVTLVMDLIACGNQDGANAVIGQIQQLANCNDDCCGQDTPSLVGGISGGGGGSNNVVVQEGSGPINITSTTVGDTTTYTINIDNSFVSQVNSLYNVNIASAPGISFTPSAPVGGVVTWTPSLSAVTIPNSLAFKVLITPADIKSAIAGSSLPITNVERSGTLFSLAPTVTLADGYNTAYNRFIVSGFYTGTPSNDYKVQTNFIINNITASGLNPTNPVLGGGGSVGGAKGQMTGLIEGFNYNNSNIAYVAADYLPYITIFNNAAQNGIFNFRIDSNQNFFLSYIDLQEGNLNLSAELHVLITE